MAIDVRPFKFSFSRNDVKDLHERLRLSRLPNHTPRAVPQGWDYGVDLDWLRAMGNEWLKLDIAALEKDIKKWPHFQATVEDIDLHFVHVKSKHGNAKPILLVHGWPGSFYEFRHLIDKLANPKEASDPAFHVVVPSLPGYAFSSPPARPGWTMRDSARIFNQLMISLGYEKYMCQGGDWGHQVCRHLGSEFTKNCKLVHLNMCPAPPPESYNWLSSSHSSSSSTTTISNTISNTLIPQGVRDYLASWLVGTPIERFLCDRASSFARNGSGYAQMQGTKPVTAGVALLDTPIGHLAWLGDKWMSWSDRENPSATLFDNRRSSDHHDNNNKVPNGGGGGGGGGEPLLLLLSHDILANVTIYWFTKTILTSFLPYLENRDPDFPDDYRIVNLTMTLKPQYYISVPFGMSSFKYELAGTTRAMVAKSGKMSYYKEHEQGGHFAALDRPNELLEDIRAFYKGAVEKSGIV